jgi:hypothetical protein
MTSFWISVVPPKMDGITATIWASQTMLPLGPHDRSTSPNRERGPTIVRAGGLDQFLQTLPSDVAQVPRPRTPQLRMMR